MTRAEAAADREQRRITNVPKVDYHRQMAWYFVCPQADGTMYTDYPNPEAAYRDWHGHSRAQHPDLPVGWPDGVRGPAPADRHECRPIRVERRGPNKVVLCPAGHVTHSVPVRLWEGSQAQSDLSRALSEQPVKVARGRRVQPSPDQGGLF